MDTHNSAHAFRRSRRSATRLSFDVSCLETIRLGRIPSGTFRRVHSLKHAGIRQTEPIGRASARQARRLKDIVRKKEFGNAFHCRSQEAAIPKLRVLNRQDRESVPYGRTTGKRHREWCGETGGNPATRRASTGSRFGRITGVTERPEVIFKSMLGHQTRRPHQVAIRIPNPEIVTASGVRLGPAKQANREDEPCCETNRAGSRGHQLVTDGKHRGNEQMGCDRSRKASARRLQPVRRESSRGSRQSQKIFTLRFNEMKTASLDRSQTHGNDCRFSPS
jgi:hypothetical protein